jgi:tetratricopeptide (TPR) repeat protein
MAYIGSMEAAYRDQDWHEVLRLAPAHLRSDEALLVGHAHWYLGSVPEGLRWLEVGLSESKQSTEELSPFRYAAGMACLLTSDLPGARRYLLEALEASVDDPWRFPSLRGLAQVEMELGLLDAADHHLRHLPLSGPSQALQHALRAKVEWRAGRLAQARANLWIALRCAIQAAGIPGKEGDPYALVDDASLLVNGAETLAGMGYGAECHRALDQAAAFLKASGVTGLPVETHLQLHRAMAYRLTGESGAAEELLAAVERAALATDARDLLASVARERGRLRWEVGDLAGAREAFGKAMEQFQAIGYLWEAEATRKETAAGPSGFVPVEPLENWFQEEAWLDEPPPVGVVVSLMLPPDEDKAMQLIEYLSEELAARLEEATEGYIDGWGTDGDEVEVFVYGDDPDVLWRALEPAVRDTGLDGTVRMEWGDRFVILLLHPPEDLSGLKRIRPLLPLMAGREARDPPLTLTAVAATAATRDQEVKGPGPQELEWVRSARLERDRIWLWRWDHPGGERYVTLAAGPGAPPSVRMDPAEGLSPEQHLVSLSYGYRSNLPADLW